MRQRIDELLQLQEAARLIHERRAVVLAEMDAMVPRNTSQRVRLGENVQDALDSLLATGGVLELDPGNHDFAPVLRERADVPLIIIRGIGAATLRGFYAPPRTHNVAFEDLGFVNPSTTAHVKLGDDRHTQTRLADVPSDFTFRRVTMVGPCRRGIAANCRGLLIEDSSITGYYAIGADSQAIAGWNGAIGHTVRRTVLEAASQAVMYGGDNAGVDPDGPELLFPQALFYEDCTFTKRHEWAALPYNVKCLIEAKNALRWTILHSRLDGSWRSASWPNGVAVRLKCSNPQGQNPTSRVEGFLMQDCIVENVGAYLSISGVGDAADPPTGRARDIAIRSNHFGTMHTEGDGRCVQIQQGPLGVVVDHNDFLENRHSCFDIEGALKAEVTFTNNRVRRGTYGFRNTNGSTVVVTHNAVQRRPVPHTNPALPATNVYYDDISGDLSAHVTSDGLPVGAGA